MLNEQLTHLGPPHGTRPLQAADWLRPPSQHLGVKWPTQYGCSQNNVQHKVPAFPCFSAFPLPQTTPPQARLHQPQSEASFTLDPSPQPHAVREHVLSVLLLEHKWVQVPGTASSPSTLVQIISAPTWRCSRHGAGPVTVPAAIPAAIPAGLFALTMQQE